MNKFKRPNEYPTLSTPPVPKDAPLPITEATRPLECIGCADSAVLLHRGTGYCRKCYDRRNYDGTLIG